MKYNPYRPIFELTRGQTVESVHYGAAAVVDAQGKLLASYGDPQGVTFLRSAAKPFQALPFIQAKGHEHYGLTQKEIALICASHSGTDEQAETAASIQAKAGVKEADLMCGVHAPYDKATTEAMLLRGEKPTANRHNCSGKHSGMLAFAAYKGWPLEDYLNFDHEVQKAILQAFSEMCEVLVEEIGLGMDGCSAPVFAVPFCNSAWGWAKLADPAGLAEERAEACRTITAAMMAHPEMVGGPGRFDTALMEATGGRIVTKAGAEGYQGVGVMPGALGPDSPGIGITLKVSDGDGRGRGRPAMTLEVLRQLGALSAEELEALAPFGPVKDVLNWRKLVVGEMRPVFELERYD